MYIYYSYLVVPVVLFIHLLPYFTYASSESNGHGKNGGVCDFANCKYRYMYATGIKIQIKFCF